MRSITFAGTTTPGTSLARNSALRWETSGQIPATIGILVCSIVSSVAASMLHDYTNKDISAEYERV